MSFLYSYYQIIFHLQNDNSTFINKIIINNYSYYNIQYNVVTNMLLQNEKMMVNDVILLYPQKINYILIYYILHFTHFSQNTFI